MSQKKNDYFDQMRKPTEQYVEAQLRERYKIFKQKSEFKKPYLEDGFPEMEYLGYDWPNVKPYYPDYPPINTSDETTHGDETYPLQPGPEDTHAGCPVYLWCDPTNPSEVKQGSSILICFEGFCSTNVGVKLLEVSDDGFSLGGITIMGKVGGGPIKACVKLSASSTCDGKAYIEAVDKDYAYSSLKYPGTNNFVPDPAAWIICTATAECDCDTKTDIAYSDSSDDTIDREGTSLIIVSDGCPPFNWSVTGTGFSFEHATTEGRTNILSADNTACGVATITVTDECGDSCTGYVRCTTGQWVETEVLYRCFVSYPTDCGQSTGGGCTTSSHETIVGYQKWYFLGAGCYWGADCNPANELDWTSTPYKTFCKDGAAAVHPPSCGNPNACHPDSCSGNCGNGEECKGCGYTACYYYEWECT